MFCVGDKIVHPMHGAGVIESIVDEKIGRDLVRFYVFRMPVSGLTLKIPTANSEMIGVRAVSSAETIERVLAELPKLSVDMTTNWNHRYRENMERIKSGDLLEVAGVIKALMHRDGERGLSTGERKMLHNARQILLSEVVLAEDVEYADAEATSKITITLENGVEHTLELVPMTDRKYAMRLDGEMEYYCYKKNLTSLETSIGYVKDHEELDFSFD